LPTSAVPHLRRSLGGTGFIEAGAGEPILFIQGAGLNAEAWAPQIEAFSATHRVIAMELAGHGERQPPRESTTLDDDVAQARRLLDDLGIAAANVVGHSMGGLIAMELAIAHPERVRRLGVLNAAAASDHVFPGKLSGLLCPTLFATADGDLNSTPAMAEAMAASAVRGRSAIIPGAGHMMPFTHGQETNRLLAGLLAERLSGFDSRDLRTAFGSFITGVTIVTTMGAEGQPRGFTANSFTSVSLEPPLLLICIGKSAASMEVFRQARGFAVNILSEEQKDISVLFASKRTDKFDATRWRPGPFGNPLIEGAAAWFDCARYQVIDAGDHIILMGQVEAFSYSDANPLGYARGHYITLGLEQAAVNAASSASRTVVGAILESDNKLVLLPDATRPNGLTLPEVGRSGASGSASQLHDFLFREGLDATLGFLFAVFENEATREQCIYYRGEALLHSRGRIVLADFDDIPWDRLPDEATRSMLRRYAEERKVGRFKIYSGDHRQGTVKAVD
jgi:flavin reductase (DIM6/NTAB) family NADH-FMN oxidoreductase RutF/pimeloyl-ACP methyl ester carboxylesterase